MFVYAIIFGILIAVNSLTIIFFCYQMNYDSRSDDSLKSEWIVYAFESDNTTPELTELIDYHRTHGIVQYKIGSNQDKI